MEVFAGKFFLFYKNSGIENGAWLVISGTTTAVTKDNYGASNANSNSSNNSGDDCYYFTINFRKRFCLPGVNIVRWRLI